MQGKKIARETIKNNYGFTLIELVIVMIIMAIIAAFIAIRMPEVDLGNQASQIVNNIRYAQSLAISANLRHRFYFSSTSYSLASYDQTSGVETFIYFPQAGSTSVTLGSGISFVKPPTPNCIAFNGRGQPCDCASGAVAAGDTVVRIGSGATTKNVIITASTGYAY